MFDARATLRTKDPIICVLEDSSVLEGSFLAKSIHPELSRAEAEIDSAWISAVCRKPKKAG